jgi:hypothetical protein
MSLPAAEASRVGLTSIYSLVQMRKMLLHDVGRSESCYMLHTGIMTKHHALRMFLINPYPANVENRVSS